MVTVLEYVKTIPAENTLVKLLADSKEEVLPTRAEDIPGVERVGGIGRGSICITPNFDICMMGNEGKWGPWI